MAFLAPVAEKAVARKVTGAAGAAAARKRAAARRAPAGGPSKLDRDRAAIQAIKDARAPEPEPEPEAEDPAPAAAVPSPTSPGDGPSLPGLGAAATGSGFLFGVFAWAVGLAYLRGGAPEVRRFMAAKFFNKVDA